MEKGKADTGILPGLVAVAADLDADALEIEYKHGKEEVCAMKNGFGMEIACFNSSGKESETLRKELYSIAGKKKMIKTDEATYTLKTEVFNSFGEDAFIVEIKQ